MKIAQVVCTFPPYSGGIGNSAYRTEQILSEKHEVYTFTPYNLQPWLKIGHGAFLPQLLFRLRKFDYIYLHYPFFGSAEVVWLFKIFFKKPKLIIHYHMDVKNNSFKTKLLGSASLLIRSSLFKKAETIICGSLDYVKHSQIKNLHEKYPDKFQEIPFGVDTNLYQPKLINRPSKNKLLARAKEIVHHINDHFIKKDRLDLVFVGGLDQAHYFKGVSILLNALAIITPRHWRLSIVGSGNLKPEYEALSEKLNLNKQVEFCGKLSEADLIRVLQNSDLLILPSTNSNEAFGLVLIEALACGVPVIASDLPGVRSVFENYQHGLLVEPGSVDDLKRKLEFIFNNEDLRRLMSLSARKLAEDKYDLSILKDRLEKLIK